MMKKILVLMLVCCAFTLSAQKKAPKWMEKGKNAVLTVTTYKADNTVLRKGVGFFVTETGDALSAYSLFKDAKRATVTDGTGNTYPVAFVMGADELYDVIKFRADVPKKVNRLPLATASVAVGAKVYLMPFATGKNIPFAEGQVVEVSRLKDAYDYYKLSFPLEAGQTSAPVLNENGEVFGLAQDDASGKNTYSFAVSAAYANNLAMKTSDAFNTVYTSIGIRKAWPSSADDALVSLYLMANTQDAKEYLNSLNDFVAHFPESPEGYLNRANHYAYNRAALASDVTGQLKMLDLALEDIEASGKHGKSAADVWFNKAKLIYEISADSTLNSAKWTVDAALESLQQAIKTDDLPAYHQLFGDIAFGRGNYEEAYNQYMTANGSATASSASYYMAAKARQNMPGANIGELIMLLDSAVAKSGKGPSTETAQYVLERVELRMALAQYKEAVEDYDLYFLLMGGRVSDAFYYYREQAKFRLGDLDGALADIKEALRMSPQDPNYYAEEAAVYVRLQIYGQALNSVDKALALAPDFAACYRLKGVCLIRLDKKNEACVAFQKAKELGDPVADKLIKEHCK